MGAIFSSPKAPDTSAQEARLAEQEKRVKQQENETKRRDAAALQARRARSSARRSLITGGETGVTQEGRATLG